MFSHREKTNVISNEKNASLRDGPELGIKFISLYMYTLHAVKLNWISIYDMGMTMTLA